jgi:hypothetical protein
VPRASLLAAVVLLAGCATIAPPPERREAAAPIAAPAGDGAGESDLPEDEADAPPEPPPPEDASPASDLSARLVARARTFLGRRGPFEVAGETFKGDCSGFVQALYAAEGADLRGLMQQTAPDERRGVAAAWLAARAHGTAFGAEAAPEPGDLVFWHDTYDRNRNRKADDRFTHVGIVEHVGEDGSVTFLHRGGKGVARGVMTLDRPGVATAPGGRRVNSTLRARAHPVKKGGLAGQLFAGYGRIGGPPAAAAPGAAEERAASPLPAPPPPRLSDGGRTAVAAGKKKAAAPKPKARTRATAKAPRRSTPPASAAGGDAPAPRG